jgi:hypothetical protein
MVIGRLQLYQVPLIAKYPLEVVGVLSEVEVCPLEELSGILRVVEWSPRWRMYPIELRCVLNGEGCCLFI